MKIYINSANENWVVDRFIQEWKKYSGTEVTSFQKRADLLWLIAPWAWHKVSKKYLKEKFVLCTIHHIDEDKFDDNDLNEFKERDFFVDQYHVISKKTYNQIKDITNKPINVIPFWVNQKIWFDINDKESLRSKYSFEKDSFLVGSFQRDTEGKDMISPKLSKGPDRFVNIVKKLNLEVENLEVVITGKRRNYIINELTDANIKFKYYEMINFKALNELYNILNLYIVSSRYEGGPQSILECGISKTPIISTDVGIASEILHPTSIFSSENINNVSPNVEFAYKNAIKYKIPYGIKNFKNLFESFK